MWRMAAVFAATGALVMTGCASNTEGSGPSTSTTAAACAAKVDEIANTVPEDIKSSGKLIVGVNAPYAPNEFKDPSGKIVGFDVDLMNAIAVHARPDRRIPRVRLRQDHPGDPGRHLQRRHVVVHRHQGARGVRRLRHLLLRGHPVGARRKGAQIDPDNACGKKVAVQATTTQETDELPAKSKTCTDAGKPAIEIIKFDGQDDATNAVVLGQADAMSADSPVTLYAHQAERRQARDRRRDLRLGALRLAGGEGFAAGGIAAEGARAPDRDGRLQDDRDELGCRERHDRQAGHQRRDQLTAYDS